MNKPSNLTVDATPERISAEELDRRFDEGEDVSAYFDWTKVKVSGLEKQRVNLDLPVSLVNRLDYQAKRRGVTRQALIKMWLADRLEANPPS